MAQLNELFYHILGAFLSLVLYGTYQVTFFMSIYYLLKKNGYKGAQISMPLIVTDCVIFLLVTAQCAIMTKQCALPFVGDAIELPLGEVFLDSTSGSENIATLALLVTELAVSNIFLVYRLWIVWGHNWSVAALPSCVLVFSIVAESMFVNNMRLVSTSTSVFDSSGEGGAHPPNVILKLTFPSAPWFTAGLSSDVFINIYSTVIRVGMEGESRNKSHLSICALPAPTSVRSWGDDSFATQPMAAHLSFRSRRTLGFGAKGYRGTDDQY
ncbi:hypothetical protein PHLGIDRAFT_16846 [Phlebiopsis gigantea 11061_1 CR5-6]|uniref:Uncharacterized protein n=1 Tax=Phlebiopsis gigantea (strain 11061_1 CR5-6) TaxID=745531 RepID=A0A0C3PAV9_PHLG1|nr:hypothetical protein PHLGIDRAFT_16846 [Phlebiopsis gigantea 11061_1 CR5-6]